MNNPNLISIFQKIDKNNSGKLNTLELQQALSNGTHRPFNLKTCQILIDMFDRSRVGEITIYDFSTLWEYVNKWCICFKSFDKNNSGDIDKNELKLALTTFGYRLSDRFYDVLLNKFDRSHLGLIKFDDFIELCTVLQTLTSSFRDKDTDRDGYINVHFEEFLSMVFESKM